MRFTEYLLAATLITGLIWMLDRLFFRPRRLMNVMQSKLYSKELKEPVLVEYCRSFFPILLAVLILRSFVIEPFRIPSGSMRPTLLEGDFILVSKYCYGLRLPMTGRKIMDFGKPERGDVVVFKHVKNGESIDMIKRVVGLPGDRIEYKDKIIYINHEPMKQTFIEEVMDHDVGKQNGWSARHQMETLGQVRHAIYVYTDSEMQRPFDNAVVPENHYFVMGDNRDNSDDSRSWGFVKEEDLLGRAFGIWMSWDSSRQGLDCLRHCIRFNRIGNRLGTPLP